MRVLLLGAGFSRNWGGWLASEVMGELCGRLSDDAYLLQLLRKKSNFEVVYGQVRQEASRNPESKERLGRLDSAIRSIFEEMNAVFARSNQFEFGYTYERSIQRYFSFFDAIFTLNQDLLLELNYYPGGYLESERRWTGCSFPGVSLPENWGSLNALDRLATTLDVSTQYELLERTQPIFKLHGSVNWKNADGSAPLVIGTGKGLAVQQIPLLAWYQDKLREFLFAGDTRIMVIGYSFSDDYLNEVLMEAASNRGLKMYLVNPAGLNALDRQPTAMVKDHKLRNTIPLVGVSTRLLRETFRTDEQSFNSFQRFLSDG